MTHAIRRLVLPFAALLFAVPAAFAQPSSPSAAPPTPDAAKPAETLSETHHTLTVGGKTIRYRALAGDILIGADDKPKARMFYVAYLAEGAGKERPLTFLFNGGPGSASVWLHLGAFGPVRVPVDGQGMPGPRPWVAVPNPNTLLDVTDLVFIDPISTGYSRALPGQEDKPYHEFHSDIESVGELVRLFVTRHERWGSPLFLAGESYGTARASGLADYLHRRFNMTLAGVVLVSPALNVATYSTLPGNDLPYPLALPAYTAAAWYHKKLPADLQGDLARAERESEAFAFGTYSDAL
ncbi:MAG TPA: peptidase S10, partial [Thermoanaerobaculia bacterium]